MKINSKTKANIQIRLATLLLSSLYILPICAQNPGLTAVSDDLIASSKTDDDAKTPKREKTKDEGAVDSFVAYATGTKFTSNRNTYKLMPGVFAVKQDIAKATNLSAKNTSSIGEKILTTKGRVSIVAKVVSNSVNSQSSAKATVVAPDKDERMVVYNERTKQVGIVIGVIQVKYQKGADPSAIAKQFGANMVADFKAIQFAMVEPNNMADIFILTEKIKADSNVISAEVEILENINRPL